MKYSENFFTKDGLIIDAILRILKDGKYENPIWDIIFDMCAEAMKKMDYAGVPIASVYNHLSSMDIVKGKVVTFHDGFTRYIQPPTYMYKVRDDGEPKYMFIDYIK